MKVLGVMEIEGSFLDLIMDIYRISTTCFIMKDCMPSPWALEQGKDVHHSSQYHTGRSSQCNKTIKRNLNIVNTDGETQIGKENRKLAVYTENVIVYVENPEESTKKPSRTNRFK